MKTISLNRRTKKREIKFPIIVRKSQTEQRVTIIYPDFMEDYQKHDALAKTICHSNTVIQCPNLDHNGLEYEESAMGDLNLVIKWVLKNTNKEQPRINLIGIGAGAEPVMAIAYKYPEVQKIILCGPSARRFPKKLLIAGLRNYDGELYLISGKNDKVYQPDLKIIKTNATIRQKTIADCGHYFSYQNNIDSLIMAVSEALKDELI